MLTTKEIIDEVTSLPIEERSYIADLILKSINSPDESIDKKWIATAKKRLDDLRTNKASGIDGDIVFEKIQKRFSK